MPLVIDQATPLPRQLPWEVYGSLFLNAPMLAGLIMLGIGTHTARNAIQYLRAHGTLAIQDWNIEHRGIVSALPSSATWAAGLPASLGSIAAEPAVRFARTPRPRQPGGPRNSRNPVIERLFMLVLPMAGIGFSGLGATRFVRQVRVLRHGKLASGTIRSDSRPENLSEVPSASNLTVEIMGVELTVARGQAQNVPPGAASSHSAARQPTNLWPRLGQLLVAGFIGAQLGTVVSGFAAVALVIFSDIDGNWIGTGFLAGLVLGAALGIGIEYRWRPIARQRPAATAAKPPGSGMFDITFNVENGDTQHEELISRQTVLATDDPKTRPLLYLPQRPSEAVLLETLVPPLLPVGNGWQVDTQGFSVRLGLALAACTVWVVGFEMF